MESQARVTQALGDRYRVERELGEGGMATVYLAHDERHDRGPRNPCGHGLVQPVTRERTEAMNWVASPA